MKIKPSFAGARGFVAAASTAPAYWMIDVLWRVLATGTQTGGSFCLLDQQCRAGSGPTRHDHPQDEGLYVVTGFVAFQAGGKTFTAGPGSLVVVPRHTDHSFQAQEDTNLLNFYLPAGFETFLMGSAVPAEHDTLPPEDFPPPPLALLGRLSEDYGGMPLTEERSTRPNPDAVAEATVAIAATAPTYWYEGVQWSVLAGGGSTGGSYCAFEVTVPAHAIPRLHLRETSDEVYYLLAGEAELLLDDCVATLAPGVLGFARRGTVTGLRSGDAGARLLVVHTAPGFERLLVALGTLAPDDGPHRDNPAPVDPKRLRDLHADIGLRPLTSLSWPERCVAARGVDTASAGAR